MSVVDSLRSTMLSSANLALHELIAAGTPILDENLRYYGFHIDTEAHSYYVRVCPYIGDYSYIYCYMREEGDSMKFPDEATVKRVKAEYPRGTRVKLVQMDDAQAPPVGTLGTVQAVDDTASYG